MYPKIEKILKTGKYLLLFQRRHYLFNSTRPRPRGYSLICEISLNEKQNLIIDNLMKADNFQKKKILFSNEFLVRDFLSKIN
jgi:hypothetical protein